MQYGYFDNEKREYVIDNVALPCSWTNYLGVEDMAAVINHTAGGYLFYKTPEDQPVPWEWGTHGPPGILCIYQG